MRLKMNTKEARKVFERLERQGRFAVALALTRTAYDAQAELKRQMPDIFDQPTRRTITSTFVAKAEPRGDLTAKVGFNDRSNRGSPAASYLRHHVDATERPDKPFEERLRAAGILPAGFQTSPAWNVEKDAHGNMRRAALNQAIKGVTGAGPQRATKGSGKKRKTSAKPKPRFFVASPSNARTAHLTPGIWRGEGREARPVLIFEKPVSYAERFRFDAIVAEVVEKRLRENLETAIDKAIATAYAKR